MELKMDTLEIKKKLSSTQKQLSDQIREESQRINAPLVANPDNADRAFDYTARSRRTSLLEKLEKHLDDVNKALRRLEDGTYGACVNCGKAIAPDRLEILPDVELCIDCQRNQHA